LMVNRLSSPTGLLNHYKFLHPLQEVAGKAHKMLIPTR
jgi:hypothetical protein